MHAGGGLGDLCETGGVCARGWSCSVGVHRVTDGHL